MTKTCAFLAAVSAFILLGVGANAATLDFETPGQCGGPEVKITTGTAETACDVEMVPNNTDGLLATTPDNSFWTARFTSAVASISVDLGDFGEDADATFLAVYDASNTLLGETHFDIAMYDDSMYTLSKSFGNNFISYAIFGLMRFLAPKAALAASMRTI